MYTLKREEKLNNWHFKCVISLQTEKNSEE